jgi:hypothetical protein
MSQSVRFIKSVVGTVVSFPLMLSDNGVITLLINYTSTQMLALFVPLASMRSYHGNGQRRTRRSQIVPVDQIKKVQICQGLGRLTLPLGLQVTSGQ